MSIGKENEERRFNSWLERLDASYSLYLSTPNENEDAKAKLLESIQQTILSEVNTYPTWVSQQKSLKLSKLASSAADLKVFLRHITFPQVLQSYNELHTELSGSSSNSDRHDDDDSRSSYSVPLSMAPISSTHDKDSRSVKAFFQSLSTNSGDGLLGLCKLADIHHRINRASEHDTLQVSTWLENEKARQNGGVTGDKLTREERLVYLKGEDPNVVLDKSFAGLKSEVTLLTEELVKAEQEEEAARRAYEAAIQRRRRSVDRLNSMETFVDNAKSQRDMLKKIDTMRAEIDAYNKRSATSRLGLFGGLSNFVSDVKTKVLDDRLSKEIPTLFNNLVSVFNQSSSGSESKFGGNSKESLFCAARVGLETIRLWRQLDADTRYPELTNRLNSFYEDLQKLQSSLPMPSCSDQYSQSVFKSDNTTVVLHFDHLYHDTPEEHVEAQSRVSTCMKMLFNRFSENSGSSRRMEVVDDNSLSRRRLKIVKCNDVLSPPAWCLPLTHSPQYLSHLWRLAEEAHKGDLYVPLEFDTEWESDNPYGEASDEDDSGPRRHQALLRHMNLPPRVVESLDPDTAAAFSKILTPREGDQIIGKFIKKQEARESAKASYRRRRDSDYSMASRGRRRKVVDTEAVVRVKTPMGVGVLLPMRNARTDSIFEVRLDFGVGYFHASSVQFVPEPEEDDGEDEEQELVSPVPVRSVSRPVSNGRSVSRPSQSNTRSRPSSDSLSGMDRTERNSVGGGVGGVSEMGKFVHTDLRLHRILQHMVNRVKVQRILGDRIGLNHANLSLWMHGRTSVGLNKTVEKAIARWLGQYDRKKVRQLLKDTENDEYSPEAANKFLARLDSSRLKKGHPPIKPSESDDETDDDNTPGSVSRRCSYFNDGNSDSEFDSEFERDKARRYSEEKVNKRFANAGGRDCRDSAAPTSSSTQSRSATAAAAAASAAVASRSSAPAPTRSSASSNSRSEPAKFSSGGAAIPRIELSPTPPPAAPTVVYPVKVESPPQSPPAKHAPESVSAKDLQVTPVKVTPASRSDRRSEKKSADKKIAAATLAVVTASAGTEKSAEKRSVERSAEKRSVEKSAEKKSAEKPRRQVAKKEPEEKVEDYSGNADAQLLRDLMASVMKTLKVSQGAIATEFYRNFRFETSHSAVMSCFHFKGIPSSFEKMNRCALFWIDDRKHHLTESERVQFAELNVRMTVAIELALAYIEASKAAAAASSTATPSQDTLETKESDMVSEMDVEMKSEADMEVEAPAAAAEVSAMEEVAPATSEEQPEIDMMSHVSQEDVNETRSAVTPSPATVELPSANADTEEPQDAMMADDESAVVDTDVPGDDRSQRSEAGTPEPQSLEQSQQHQQEAVSTTSQPKSINVSEVRTIADLHNAVVFEMARRGLSQSATVVEADLVKVGMGQPALSKFLSIATVTNNARGSKFCQLMLKWLEVSRNKPPTSTGVSGAAATAASSSESLANIVVKADPDVKMESVEPTNGSSTQSVDETSGNGRVEPRVASTDNKSETSATGFDANTCGICAKHVSEFTNHKSFHMHIAWCYRRKRGVDPPPEYKMKTLMGGNHGGMASSVNSNKRKLSSTVDNPTDDEGGTGGGADGNESDHTETADVKRSKTSSGNEGSSSSNNSKHRRDESSSNTGPGAKPGSGIDGPVVEADSFPEGHHYETCDVCRDIGVGQVLLCEFCPCIYHAKCANYPKISQSGKIECLKCIEAGAQNSTLMPPSMKNSPEVENKWILVYSTPLRRWRKAVVISKHATRDCTILVKWWRSDNRGGKTIWLDISKAPILITEDEVRPSQYSRNKMQQLSNTSKKLGGVQFDESAARNARSRPNLNAQFKSQRIMLMDGNSNGSVPPSAQLAANGVGGVGALKDADDDEKPTTNMSGNGMSDTYVSSNSLKAALCASGIACRAVDIAMCNTNTNVFACIRPPGHHAGRYGCTSGCLSTGFCLLNNAAIAAYYARVRWGLDRVAVVDIDVHFGNGTAEVLRHDPNAFFASVHMIYGYQNDGGPTEASEVDSQGKKRINAGFYPSLMGQTEITDTYVSVGVYPQEATVGPRGGKLRKKKVLVAHEEGGSDSSDSETERESADLVLAGESGNAEGDNRDDLDSLDNRSIESMMMVVESADPTAISEGGDAPSLVSAPDSPSKTATSKVRDSSLSAIAAAKQGFSGAEGFLRALKDVIIPQMDKFNPQLLIISAGFDGYVSDPVGGALSLSLEDYVTATKMLTSAMDDINARNGVSPNAPGGKRVISLLEGGYDTSPNTLGLAKCVDAHVLALQDC